jgi:hypothetical protein
MAALICHLESVEIPQNWKESFVKYKIESIGAAFNDRAVTDLAERLTHQSDQGWELHSVFSVEKKGCLGVSEGKTYLAIYRQEE